ncbi:MAG: DNA polymerase III subunit beta, partial [Bacteroidia bacterium]|nr:DNA polymerase III subunit beta [Bacteroidia bacterium]
MKFIVSSSTLLKHLQMIHGVIMPNNPLPALDNFLFEIEKGELTASASDLETTISTRIKVEAKQDVKICIHARILMDTLKTFAEHPLTFNIDEKKITCEVSSDYGKYKMSAISSDDYPRIPEADSVSSIQIPSAVMLNAINKTLFATGNDEMRPVMSGVFCQLTKKDMTFVATDAHRLVRYRRTDAASPKEISFIIPKKPLTLLKNVLPNDDSAVKIDYNDSNAFFSFDHISLICRLIDGKYPNYEAVIPTDNPNHLTVDRNAFLSSVKRISIFSNKTTYQVRLKITGSELNISAEDPDFSNEATERLTCQYKGEDME